MSDKRSPAAVRVAKSQRKLRKQVIEVLGGKCVRCGFDDPRALQVDHIKGGGSKEKRKIGSHAIWRKIVKDPEARKEYQLLCANCNWIKRAENREERGGTLRPRTSLTERTATCQQCGKEFTYNPSDNHRGKFCSTKCSGKRRVTLETRRKMSESHKGQPVSEETRRKLSELNSGEKNPFYGRHHSEEVKRKLSELNSGEKNPFYGRRHLEETKQKISESLKDRTRGIKKF